MYKQQKGVVIIIALFIMALVATLTYVMIARLDRDTRRTALILSNVQAENYAQGSLYWAIDVLRNNWEQQKPNQLIDHMPIQSPLNQENGYTISTAINDMQAKFNLNNLMLPNAAAGFKHMMLTLYPSLKEDEANQIIIAIKNWITDTPQSKNANKYYINLSPPYRAAQRAMVNISELKLVKGITPELFEALAPYITALPQGIPINIQTASAPVLLTLSASMTIDAANAIVQFRQMSPFKNLQEFQNLEIVKNHQIKNVNIDVVSHYFLAKTVVTIENQQITLYTLLQRVTNTGKAKIISLWQSKNVEF